jgi:hypothetical protein
LSTFMKFPEVLLVRDISPVMIRYIFLSLFKVTKNKITFLLLHRSFNLDSDLGVMIPIEALVLPLNLSFEIVGDSSSKI